MTTNGMYNLAQTSSKDDLFLALRAWHQGATIRATDTEGRTFKLTVQSIEHEDGSGNSFNVTGFAELQGSSGIKKISFKYQGYISYKGGDRKGFIKIT